MLHKKNSAVSAHSINAKCCLSAAQLFFKAAEMTDRQTLAADPCRRTPEFI